MLSFIVFQGQPQRTLPNQVQFEVFKQPSDPLPDLYHLFDSCAFVDCLLLLVASPLTLHSVPVFAALKDMITCLLKDASGLRYLAAHVDSVNAITRTLTQTPVNYRPDMYYTPMHGTYDCVCVFAGV